MDQAKITAKMKRDWEKHKAMAPKDVEKLLAEITESDEEFTAKVYSEVLWHTMCKGRKWLGLTMGELVDRVDAIAESWGKSPTAYVLDLAKGAQMAHILLRDEELML